MKVRWRAFPLHPDTPAEGRLLADMFRTTPEKIAAMMTRLQLTALELGLPFGPRTFTYNSRLAQELGLWAEEKGKGKKFHMAAFHAYFADGLNIAEIPVLVKLAGDAGLSEEEAADVLLGRLFKERVDQDWLESQQQAITAVPTMVYGGHQLVGAHDYAALVRLVSQAD